MTSKMPTRETLKDEERKGIIDMRIEEFIKTMQNFLGEKESLASLEGDQIFYENATAAPEKKSITDHPFLIRAFNLVLKIAKELGGGIFFVDPKGVYVPIEAGKFGICHLVRIPRRRKDVFAITDFGDIAFYKYQENDLNFLVIFQGVKKTINNGYKFIRDGFFIKPIPALSPLAELEYTYKPLETRTDRPIDRENETEYDEEDEEEKPWM